MLVHRGGGEEEGEEEERRVGGEEENRKPLWGGWRMVVSNACLSTQLVSKKRNSVGGEGMVSNLTVRFFICLFIAMLDIRRKERVVRCMCLTCTHI